MRLHKLEVKNIASLKGRHVINLDQIMDNSNLFAITGPTGSGKSTLLNSISLALYGKVYKEGSSSQDFVTIGEADGEINLTFSHGDTFFEAYWFLKVLKSNGEFLKTPKLTRVLYQLTTDGKEALEKTVEDIIHLNFAQFCKTSILNQGQFAKFLTSSFTERKEILEKFYEGEDLAQLSPKLRERINLTKHHIEKVDSQIQGINESIESIKIDEKTLKEKKEQHSKIKASFNLLTKIKERFLDTFTYITKKSIALNKKTEILKDVELIQINLNESQKENKTDTEQYTKAKEDLNQNKALLSKAIEQVNRMGYLSDQLKELEKDLKVLDTNLKDEKSNLLKLKEENEKLAKANDHILEDNKLIEKFSAIDLSRAHQNLKELIKGQVDLKKQNEATKIRIVNKEKELNSVSQEILRNKNELSQFDKTIHAHKIEKLEALNDQYQQLNSIVSNSIELKSKWDESIVNHKEKLNSLEKELKDLFQKEHSFMDEIKTLDQAILDRKNIEALHICITRSLKDNACVVCGNSDLSSIKNESDSKDQIQSLLDKKEKTNSELLALKEEISQHSIKKAAYQNEITSLNERIYQEQAKALVIWNKCEGLPYLDKILNLKALDLIRSEISKNTTVLENSRTQSQNMNLLEQKTKLLEDSSLQIKQSLDEHQLEFKNISEKQKENHNQKLALYKKLQLTSDDSENNLLLDHAQRDALTFENNTKRLEQLKIQLLNSNQRIDSDNEKYKKLIGSKKILDSEVLEIKSFLSENNIDFDPKIKLASLEQQLEKTRKKKQESDEALKSIQINIAESKSRLNSQEDFINELEQQIITERNSLHELSTEFFNKEQLSFFTPIIKLIKNFQKFDPKEDLQIIKTTNENFESQYEELQTQFRAKEKELTEAETLFRQLQDNLEKIKQIESDKKDQKAYLDRLESLNILIGKDEFRNFVLAIIENNLIQQTNHELTNLCDGRYQLIQTQKTNRQLSEFKIIDHYHGGYERKISTLSGGETFLVSLALALALAEMTRGQTQIDSLFIDEGFGTLDQDSIEDVLDLLTEIQTSGKQIGIISHVQKLTNRIPVNLNLIKGQDGLSTIETVLN